MAADNYRRSEDQYFKLRGQFDTGRITQEQFDEKLRDLMVQDAQGRYWMLGADSGKWYFYDGSKWVQGDPYLGAPPGPVAADAPTIAVAAPVARAAAASTPTAAPESGRRFPLVPVLLVLLALALGAAAFFLFQNRDRIFVAQAPQQITAVLPPTITRAPSPTPLSVQSTSAAVGTAVQATIAVPTVETPTTIPDPPTTVPLPTDVPPTPEPAITVIVITPIPTVTLILPTLLPTATDLPTFTPTSVPTVPPATAAPTLPPTAVNTPLPNVPPDVYATGLTVSPNPAKKNQQATFSATFLNTTGATRAFNLVVLLYDPNKNGPNKQFGESPPVSVNVPPGESVQTILHIPATGPGGCVPLYARMGYQIGQFDKPIFPNITADLATLYFDACPP